MKFNLSAKVIPFLLLALLGGTGCLRGKMIPANDPEVIKGLSALNWVVGSQTISTAAGGASFALAFTGTRRVALQVDTSALAKLEASRYPVVGWSVNGGSRHIYQVKPGETAITLVTDEIAPQIDFYAMGFSPFEDRYGGEHPINSLRIAGFQVEENGRAAALPKPARLWLNIGDSIMSGDAALERANQGRPADSAWAACTDARASYGYLLAQHYGCAESRIAYGGYDYGAGMASLPDLSTLADQTTSLTSRLNNGKFQPLPAVVLINLGENGAPSAVSVTDALAKLRLRAGPAAKIIVMVPVSGKARAEITAAYKQYRDASHDGAASLVDLGSIRYETADGCHPTAAGHRTIYQASLAALANIVR